MFSSEKHQWKSVTTLLLLSFLFIQCNLLNGPSTEVKSPSGNIAVQFFLNMDGAPGYLVKYQNELIIDSSFLGFEFQGQEPMSKGFEILNIQHNTIQEEWEMPWGEQSRVENHCNEMQIELKEIGQTNRSLVLVYRVFEDGIGFRYEFPEQIGLDSLIVLAESTEFQLTEDHTCWWIPGDWDIYEHLYNTSTFSAIDAISKRNHPNLAQTYIPYNAVNTPVTMKTRNDLYLSFHEANLTDYPGMTLRVDKGKLKMTSELVGSDRFGYKAKIGLPFKTPWRTIQISPDAGGLIESNLILNLNEPSKIENMDWFKPQKYVGIWWELHLGISTWNIEGGKHGATTENAKKYIDFASKNNIGGVLVEGWNTGWDHWIGFDEREGVFDFVTPYPDYDLEEVVRYAKEKGVEIIMHHETSAAPRTYDTQLDTAFALMKNLGIKMVKTGYVGEIIPDGEYHHGQWMVNHYRRVIQAAAKNQIAVNAHEPIKDTGIRRTYPNEISREGLRGQEFNAWASDGGNPPEHLSIVAFTRMLAGPIDFTPGVFEMSLPSKPDNKINTTLAHQLALYVVVYSPIQMACDLPYNYKDQAGFQFIRDVGTDWEETRVLNGEIGDYVTIARKEKRTGNWFIGSITDEKRRMIQLDLDFLTAGISYDALVYRDGERASYKINQTDIAMDTLLVDQSSKLAFYLAEGGGFAISLKAKK